MRFALVLMFLCATTSFAQLPSAPVLVKRVEPVYTEAAKAARVVGDITLKVAIHQDGTVAEVGISESCLGVITAHREPNGGPFKCRSAHEYERVNGFDQVNGDDPSRGLDEQVQRAVRQWVFQPSGSEAHILVALTLRVPR
jgi:hypothetical protein